MVAKVGADVANTQTSTTGLQIFRMLISRFVQCIDLWNNQQCKNTPTSGESILVKLSYIHFIHGRLILSYEKRPLKQRPTIKYSPILASNPFTTRVHLFISKK